MKTKFCSECGKECIQNIIICPSCGNSAFDRHAPSKAGGQNPVKPVVSRKRKRGTENKSFDFKGTVSDTVGWPVFLVIGLLLVIPVVYMVFYLIPAPSVKGDEALRVTRNFDGHFYITAEINGKRINLLFDTGATQLVLSHRDTIKIGVNPLNLRYGYKVKTANGVASAARFRIDKMRLGSAVIKNIAASTTRALDFSLLGVDVLSRFSSYRVEKNTLILTP